MYDKIGNYENYNLISILMIDSNDHLAKHKTANDLWNTFVNAKTTVVKS